MTAAVTSAQNIVKCCNKAGLNVIDIVANDLDDLLLPYTFDLSIFQDIDNPDLLAHIRRVGVTFYQKDEAIPEPS